MDSRTLQLSYYRKIRKCKELGALENLGGIGRGIWGFGRSQNLKLIGLRAIQLNYYGNIGKYKELWCSGGLGGTFRRQEAFGDKKELIIDWLKNFKGLGVVGYVDLRGAEIDQGRAQELQIYSILVK